MDIDWLKASEEERMQLYKLTFNVGKLLNLTVYQIMDAALGRKIAMGKDYVANFRKGKIRRAYAKLIYKWLTEHHFDLLLQIAPEKFPETPEQRWQAILEERVRSDRFRLVLIPKSMGIVERESQLKPADMIMRLGERFCFELDSEVFAKNRTDVQGNRPHERPPVTDHQPMLAVPCRSGPSHLRPSGISTAPGRKATKPGGCNMATELENLLGQLRAKRKTAHRHQRRNNRQRSFPIVSPRPSRLPPWELFQRGSFARQNATLTPRPASENLHLSSRS
ncbi:hypothetical protein CEW89_15395 [Celeribacter ethanolicus]|uniref:Uncharacterized protein n=1 Tax=Celeribacter ethanolicus TaxID=1758178 RepID=A0A291GF68_9RHOB|nr:hypothetical protein [Celeribacter ethanolicus]ATG48831.1 hypothetical protein CEW89_15395 [Celeribacter ethanolicus]